MQNMNWFHSLKKPFLAPPDWIFTPIWAILYFMIFLSLVFFLKTNGNLRYKFLPIIFFTTQMILNFAWSYVFFSIQRIDLAFIVIILLWVTLLITIAMFFKQSRISAYLLVPYFLWVSFATYLNYGYLRLNS